MYLHFGKRPYGKCDVVPELFHVATLFFHIDFLPLVPVKSYIILGKRGNQYHGVPIPLSFKSVFYAWSRTAFFAAAVTAWSVFGVSLYDNQAPLVSDLTTPLLIGSLCTIAYLFVMIYPRCARASYQRACQLAMIAKLNDQSWAALNVLYDRDPFDRPPAPEPLRAR